MQENNYAFFDAQNLYMRTKANGWSVYLLHRYLKNKYATSKVFWFTGYLRCNRKFYKLLKDVGFITIFKEVLIGNDGKPKGNIDVDLTLHTIVKMSEYNKALLVTSDGDFAVLVKYLKKPNLLLVTGSHYFINLALNILY
jgi:uncharacterized LabA/DUF88 family protein